VVDGQDVNFWGELMQDPNFGLRPIPKHLAKDKTTLFEPNGISVTVTLTCFSDVSFHTTI
jgi:hypothetical protein